VIGPRALLRRLLRRRSPSDGSRPGEDHRAGVAALGLDGREMEEHERQMIERVFRLGGMRAWDVMTPRVDMLAWPGRMTLAELAPQLRTVRYSRVPVFGETIDDVVGILYIRDAYQALVSGQRDVTLRELAREPFFVPGSVSLIKLLSDFRTRRIHLGVVIDEYGGTDGLATLEDILEELVGDIVDETDVEEQPIVRVSRNEVLVEGYADLREINHFFNTSLPQLEHRSLNGYLLEELGYVPRPGAEFEREGVRIRIEDASETQVLRARLTRPHQGEDERGPSEAEGARNAGRDAGSEDRD